MNYSHTPPEVGDLWLKADGVFYEFNGTDWQPYEDRSPMVELTWLRKAVLVLQRDVTELLDR